MLAKIFIVLILFTIIGSLFSGLFYLVRDKPHGVYPAG
jgi:hypothetical protein